MSFTIRIYYHTRSNIQKQVKDIQRNRDTDRETESLKDRETHRQRDSETESHRDTEAGRETEKKIFKDIVSSIYRQCDKEWIIGN